MKNELTPKELQKLGRVFSPRDIEMILKKFTVEQIREVINGD